MQTNELVLNSFIKRVLPYFLSIIFITTIIYIFINYYEHDGYTIGDWLINYQAGFVRRGFFGEVVYRLSYYTNINIGLYVVLFQTIFFLTYFYFSYAMLKQQKNILPFALLIFSPYIFMFQVVNDSVGYRKEIIYFAILSTVAWSTYTNRFKMIFYIVIALYPLVILSHEMLALFLPYVVVIFILNCKITKKDLFAITILLLISVVVLIVILKTEFTTEQINKLLNSLTTINYSIQGGSVRWLDRDLLFAHNDLVEYATSKRYYLYPIVLLVAIIAYLPLLTKIKELFKNKLVLLLILSSLIGSLFLLFFILDWGRVLYIHLVSLFIILLTKPLLQSVESQKYINYINNFSVKTIVIILILYGSLWSLIGFGNPMESFKRPLHVVEGFVKPYLQATDIVLFESGIIKNRFKK